MLNQLFKNRPTIYVEKVAYFRSLAILHGFHYETKAIRVDLDGIDTEDMERVWARDLANVKTEKDEYAAVLYLVPQFSNPLGTVMNESKSAFYTLYHFFFFREIKRSCTDSAQIQCACDLRRCLQPAL